MKICPRCKKEYDNTWGTCLQCSVPLSDVSAAALSPRDAAALRAELAEIRDRMARLTEQMNRIEYRLTPERDEPLAKTRAPLWKEPAPRPEEPVERRDFVAFEEGPGDDRSAAEPRKSLAENFEQILGGKWFNKLGILAVVIGVALLVGYSFRFMGPAGKIAIGYAFAAAMIAGGRFAEKREGFAAYGKGVSGGGWAIAYFTTFALHHIPAVRLVASPVVGMALLLGVSAAAVVDIYRYRSEFATGFSYLLIFITLMISPLSLYTMAAMVPVVLSLAFFMWKMRWPGFGIYGVVMTYMTFMAWFNIAQRAGAPPMVLGQFLAASFFLFLYWAIFAGTTLISKDDAPAAADAPQPFRIRYRELFHILNTCIATFNACSLILAGFTQYGKAALLIAVALYLGLTIATFERRQRPLYIINSTCAIAYVAWLAALVFTGYKLTVAYIILTQAVLLAGILLKESYWRLLSFAGLGAVLVKLLVVDSFFGQNRQLGALTPHLTTRTVLFGFAFVVYLVNHLLYSRLGRRGLLTETEEDHAATLSYAYPLIYAMGTWLDLPKVLTAPAWVILGAILLQLGVWKDNRHQRIQGYILTIGAFTRLLMSNMLVQGGVGFLSYRLLTSVPVLIVLYYCLMLLQDPETQPVLRERERTMVWVFPSMVFAVIMFLIWYEAPKNLVAPVWGIAALAYSVRGVFSKKSYYLSIGTIAAIATGMRAFFVNIYQARYLVGAEGPVVYPAVAVALLFAGNIFYLRSKRALACGETAAAEPADGPIGRFLHSSRLVYGMTATALLTALLIAKTRGVLLTASLGLEGMALLLAGFALKDKQWRMYGLVILLMTLAKAFLVDLRQLSTLYYILSLIVLGLALLFVSYLYTKHKEKIKKLM